MKKNIFSMTLSTPFHEYRALDESISVVRSMWIQHRATFIGKHYSIKNVICNPKPIQKPHPVIMIAGEGERYLLKVVAKHADRYNHSCGSIQVLKRKISIIKELVLPLAVILKI
jgi:alkanesulfonate monooxygenase SsuD/methylene tetrahydromethanopterin reductase-like flavin-dependent oxidoreductase (luciferase family)